MWITLVGGIDFGTNLKKRRTEKLLSFLVTGSQLKTESFSSLILSFLILFNGTIQVLSMKSVHFHVPFPSKFPICLKLINMNISTIVCVTVEVYLQKFCT